MALKLNKGNCGPFPLLPSTESSSGSEKSVRNSRLPLRSLTSGFLFFLHALENAAGENN